MSAEEQPLSGGHVTPGVVRVGTTVRRPAGANSAFVHALLTSLGQSGFAGAPRFLGQDAAGREVLTFFEGEVPRELGFFAEATLATAARLLRTLHDLTASCSLRGDAEVVCHGDPSPCNAVFRGSIKDGLPYAFIDFDAARPGARREDVGYAAWLWLDIGNAELDPVWQGARLRTFVSAYGALSWDDALPSVLEAQAELAARADASGAVRSWAADCRAWTTANRTALGA